MRSELGKIGAALAQIQNTVNFEDYVVMKDDDQCKAPTECALDPESRWVQPNAACWGESQFLPRVPSLEEIICAVDARGVDLTYPAKDSPEGRAEIEELIDLSQLRDDPSALYAPGKRRAISRFLQLRPQPYGAVYNRLTPETEPVIRTGRELARWFESETPGLAERQALNYLLPQFGWSPPRQARVWCALDCAIYGALLAAWYYKWRDARTQCRPRPWQVSKKVSVLYNVKANATVSGDGPLARNTFTALNEKGEIVEKPLETPGTPRHPAFPAGHSTVAGAGFGILSHFFPDFISDFEDLADNEGMARLWAGIHYRSDHTFGLELGKTVASLIIERLEQDDSVSP
ncbi:MAG: phosphatase PAP2 family protein [Cyanobacteriota bacterium]|nr:phosphatase PAP2 family protein [Cyanobacteriota bacterium]